MEQISEPVVHGALDYEELERLGLHPDDIYDFSVNSNPYGPSPRVREALNEVPIERYPDRACLALRRTIQTYELNETQLPLDAILCGNGTAELIGAIARAFLQPGTKAALLGPTFGEYRAVSLAVGASVVTYTAQAAEQFYPDMDAVVVWLEHEQPALLWLCNPNNPTGIWLDRRTITLLSDICQRIGTLLVIDEAYWHFLVPQEAFSAVELVQQLPELPLIVLRSLTKDFALAGVRLGYAVATPALLARVHPHLSSWNVSGFAQAAGCAAVSDRAYLVQTLQTLALERQAFFQALLASSLHLVPSRTHFCLLEVGDAASVRQHLLRRHLLVRDCTSFGLPQYIRVATQQRSHWQLLVQVLQDIFAQ
jgi:histidinol-phosphate aminotransferase